MFPRWAPWALPPAPVEPDLIPPPNRYVDPRGTIREDDVDEVDLPTPPHYPTCASCGDPQTWPGDRCIACRIGNGR